jgi:hypothetical protein
VGLTVVSKTKIYFEQIPIKVVKEILAGKMKEKQSAQPSVVPSGQRKQEARA